MWSYKKDRCGVYHGAFVATDTSMGRPRDIWVLSRPHNWRPRSVVEELLKINLVTGSISERRSISSRFAHDAVRQGNRGYIASTGDGCIVELELPACKLVQRHHLFAPNNHINALAPVGNASMWVLLHNRGESDVVLMDTKRGMQAVRHNHVGTHAHGLVIWGKTLLILDSGHSALVGVDSSTGKKETLWQGSGEGNFLKGLAVIDDVAYFGISPGAERSMRANPELDCELAALALLEKRLLWRRKVPTHGLLNTIAAPHLAEGSTYKAVKTEHRKMKAAAVSDVIGGYWSSGMPYLKSSFKTDWDPTRANSKSLTGVQLLLFSADISNLKAAILDQGEALWDAAEQRRSNAFLKGRAQNMQRYKPGTQEVLLMFSDKEGGSVYRFPYYDRFKNVMEPLLEQVLGRGDMAKVMRLLLARVLPGSLIRIHRDQGGYVERGHRIHVPLQADPSTLAFMSCPTAVPHAISPSVTASQALGQGCLPLQIEEGLVFEINNAVAHLVHNQGSTSRIHLIVDVAEHALLPPRALKPGQECAYKGQVIVC
ncbi:hypothetical protein COCOBI_06-4830 [Coccomyxa sp. Obi]|nr:hypothetical protein COCOBI_06-4830 [Coccomyxa sp. Obi]